MGVGPDVRVAIFFERLAQMIICVLAALKAGGAYVPVDPAYPPSRRQFILRDARVAVVITQHDLAPGLVQSGPEENGCKLVCMDAEWDVVAARSRNPPAHAAGPESLA